MDTEGVKALKALNRLKVKLIYLFFHPNNLDDVILISQFPMI